MRTIEPALWLNYETGEFQGSQARYGNPSPYFRKEFELGGKKAVKAIWQVSAVGVFKAYINGMETDGDYMSPGWTDYRVRTPLIEYDVLDKLDDKNALMIVAGDGWAVGFMGNEMKRTNYARKIRVAAKLTVTFEDGEVMEVITDGSWRARAGEIRRTDNYMGEVVDHNWSIDCAAYHYGYDAEANGWNKVNVRNDEFRTNSLCDEVCPRIKVMHRLPATVLSQNERFIMLDMKQNMVGVLRIKAKGHRGDRITVRHGEMLESDGSLYTENLRASESTDLYILSGKGEEEFRPLFTFHGFRYAEIRLTGNVEILSVEGEVMYSAMPKTGEWECSDPLLNQLYSNIVWGQRGNFLSVPTDCPQRDERLGWTGDAQIFSGTAMYNMDCEGFYDKYIQDLIDSQIGNGAISSVAPHVPHPDLDDVEARGCAAGWGDAIAIIPYERYLMYGNRKKLRYALPFIKKFIAHCVNQSDGLIRPREPNYGDWLNANCNTDKSLLSTEYFAFSTLLTARMCDFVGDDEAAEYYDLHAKIKKAFRDKFLLDNGKLTCHTQTAYLLARASEVMSTEEIRDSLLDTLHAANDMLTTGFLGVKFLLPTLCDLGESALAYKLLANREYPGWLYSVVNGATTIWERWNGWTVEHGFGDVGMNSFNHYSLGSCGEWMFKYCLGIVPRADGAGFEKLTLKPYVDFSGKLTYARGSYDSKRGKISAEWSVSGDKAVYKARVPKDIELEVCVPDNVEAIIERY